MVNLLTNAAKYTTDSGHVWVDVLHEGDMVEVRVRDTGIGIAPEAMSRLFQSFSQVDASTSRRFGGTGLGLVISKRLAEMMGGRMWVESEVGRGSTFFFTILVESANSSPPFITPATVRALSTKPAAAVAHSERILIAEDNAVNQKVAALMLEKLGFRADVAADGREVLTALKRQRYDIIMMDVQMPEMDGLAAAREIGRLYPKREDRPWIIAVTANAMNTDREACLAAGMDDYIAKPVVFEELAAALERGCHAISSDTADR
jgi:CheY-like chemotaxis protein